MDGYIVLCHIEQQRKVIVVKLGSTVGTDSDDDVNDDDNE